VTSGARGAGGDEHVDPPQERFRERDAVTVWGVTLQASIAAVTDDGELVHFPLPAVLPVGRRLSSPAGVVATEDPECG
jgi:hypothetical protein